MAKIFFKDLVIKERNVFSILDAAYFGYKVVLS
jgi:hypothetical protein